MGQYILCAACLAAPFLTLLFWWLIDPEDFR